MVAGERLGADLGRRVEASIARCGLSCAVSIQSLVGTGSVDLRMMAYSILPRIRGSEVERRELWQRIAAAAPPPEEMNAEERRAWERTAALVQP
jgi:hypothetical protein